MESRTSAQPHTCTYICGYSFYILYKMYFSTAIMEHGFLDQSQQQMLVLPAYVIAARTIKSSRVELYL